MPIETQIMKQNLLVYFLAIRWTYVSNVINQQFQSDSFLLQFKFQLIKLAINKIYFIRT